MSGIEKLASRGRSRGGVVVVVGLISVGWLGKGEGGGSERERERDNGACTGTRRLSEANYI